MPSRTHEGKWGTTYFTVSTYITCCKEKHEQKQRSLDEGEQRQGGAQNFNAKQGAEQARALPPK